MKTETMIALLENDIAQAKRGLKREDEGYPFICGWLEGCIQHMAKVLTEYKESNNGTNGNI